MNGYSKISTKSSHKPRSVDFSDFYSFSPPLHEEHVVKREKQENDEGFSNGVILGRSGSVSSSASASVHGTVKKAFSMRRSSSVSESYCRIHDQYMTIVSPLSNIADHEIDDDMNNGMRTTTITRRRRSIKLRGGKIFKACKRLLGL
ncbi:hypothetical protein Lal_00043987 [Lupinus albus]|uniref:Uncharacterized protein n=1 Tax=Lupinus albus TaxID=3870 RepID=A0A6A4P3R1_LUPAL|nr:hypothetical protein Lalb_Chr15g0090761 [Lupinus albus]KAF1895341.1 hypothetical protein Lal_00043987 [Lupinus albus]